jgi:hypothetical protein
MSASPADLGRARGSAHRFSLRNTPACDLLAELDERLNDLASYEADLDASVFADGNADRLRGDIAYERHHVELIVDEMERRERARAFGYQSPNGLREQALAERFAAAKAIDCAEVMRTETCQAGKPVGERTLFTCPFHPDDTPSLTCYPGEGGWYCFSCRRGGDAVKLVAEIKSVGAVEALRFLEVVLIGAA